MRGHIDNLRAETLTSLSLTHVRFVGDDIYSKIFAFITLSPFGITCGYIAVILATRDLSIVLMLAGQFLNECVNYVLKRVIKQERPTTGTKIKNPIHHCLISWIVLGAITDLALSISVGRLDLGLGEGYGMPSSHSQFMAYFATYMILLMYRQVVFPGFQTQGQGRVFFMHLVLTSFSFSVLQAWFVGIN
jgi:dolichyldiphosphatase